MDLENRSLAYGIREPGSIVILAPTISSGGLPVRRHTCNNRGLWSGSARRSVNAHDSAASPGFAAVSSSRQTTRGASFETQDPSH